MGAILRYCSRVSANLEYDRRQTSPRLRRERCGYATKEIIYGSEEENKFITQRC